MITTTQNATEEELAALFDDCGQVIDCRLCGDPNSSLRFAFIEFINPDSIEKALKKSGTLLGDIPIRCMPSKTAIVPVNAQYLPQNENEREMCERTVYIASIDKVNTLTCYYHTFVACSEFRVHRQGVFRR